LNRIFAGENAKNRAFCGGIKQAALPFTTPELTIRQRYEIVTALSANPRRAGCHYDRVAKNCCTASSG
jgi:hypothetical protein